MNRLDLARLVINGMTRRHTPMQLFAPTLKEQVNGKVVLITGASSGIGRELARRVAESGAITVVTARRADLLEDLSRELRSRGATAHAIGADLSTTDGVEALAGEVLRRYGAPGVLALNAGRSIMRPISDSEFRLHDYERTIRTNYLGAVGLTLRLLPAMRERGSGHVLHSSSIGVQANLPMFSAYIGSKAALEAFMRVAAVECLGDGIVFTNINFPLTKTDMIGPTDWKGYAALTVDEAADMLIDAIRRRPYGLSTPLGSVAAWTNRLFPGAARSMLNVLYRSAPATNSAVVDPANEAVRS